MFVLGRVQKSITSSEWHSVTIRYQRLGFHFSCEWNNLVIIPIVFAHWWGWNVAGSHFTFLGLVWIVQPYCNNAVFQARLQIHMLDTTFRLQCFVVFIYLCDFGFQLKGAVDYRTTTSFTYIWKSLPIKNVQKNVWR